MDNTKSYKRGLRRNLRKQTLESMMRPYVPETIETEEETNQQNTVLDRAEELNDIVKCSPNGSLLNDNNRMDYGSKTVTSTDITETRLEAEQFSNNESNEEVNKTPTIEDPCTLCGSKHSPTPEKVISDLSIPNKNIFVKQIVTLIFRNSRVMHCLSKDGKRKCWRSIH